MAEWGIAGKRAQIESLKIELLRQLHRAAHRSQGLEATIGFAVRYMQIDPGAKERILDVRALLMGLLNHGSAPSERRDTAHSVYQWLSGRVGPASVIRALATEMTTDPDQLLGEPAGSYPPIFSQSLMASRKEAARIATQTVRTRSFALRHLFAALIDTFSFQAELNRLFSISLTAEDIISLKMALIEGIMRFPEPGETRERWMEALGLSLVFEPETETPPTPADGVPGFSRDKAAAPKDDLLGTAADATALARLICLEDATPLALAVFGGWGSGKSTFMDRLDQEIEDLTQDLAERGDAPAEAGQARFVRRVVQIRFNAWQFVDANLWASLTAEFFDQLRAGGWRKVTAAQHTGLVEKVNQHVHALTAEAEAGRASAVEGDKALLKAQVARDKAAAAAKEAAKGVFKEAALQALGDAFESQKGRLQALGLETSGKDIGKAVDTTVEMARDLGESFGHLRAFLRALLASGWRMAWTAGGLAAAIWGAWVGVPLLVQQGLAGVDIKPLLALVAGAGAAISAASPAVKLVLGLAKRGGAIAKAAKEADETSLKAVLASELKLREVSKEAEARREAVQRTEHALARYVDPAAGRNPPRLLRYVLEDDPDTKALEKEIGLIGRTRRLFQAVDSIVTEERGKAPNDRAAGEVPDRIVLYIDDLDRCTEAQVYAVLQAVHLLLSFDLFAVVVGVDVAWVQEALAKSFRDKGDSRERTDEEIQKDRERASQYLEKIFQVAFWLSPLEGTAADTGAYGRYVRALALPPPVDAPPPAAETETPPAETVELAKAATGEPAAEAPASEGHDDGEAESVTLEGLDTIMLDEVEVAFLASPEIAGIAASTPRGVKRLINVYRLARMRLAQGGGLPLGHGDRPADYPFLALLAAVETGRPMAVADDVFHGLAQAPQDQELRAWALQAVTPMTSDANRLARAVALDPKLKTALLKVLEMRPTVSNKDVNTIARIVRRYSFNSFC